MKFDIDDEEPSASVPAVDAGTIPYAVMERAVAGDYEAQRLISPARARKLLEERDLARRLSEHYE